MTLLKNLCQHKQAELPEQSEIESELPELPKAPAAFGIKLLK